MTRRAACLSCRRNNLRESAMKKFLLTAAALCVAPAVAHAMYFNATYDCDNGQTVWIANPVKGPFGSKERGRKVIFEITISDFDLEKGPVHSPVIKWDVHKDEVTSDGRSCRARCADDAVLHPRWQECRYCDDIRQHDQILRA
jgi:hypothetical protein